MCHVAKSSFYDAVCAVSLDLGLQEFSVEKEKHRSWSISEQFLVLQKQSDLWVNFLSIAYSLEDREEAVVYCTQENTQQATVPW